MRLPGLPRGEGQLELAMAESQTERRSSICLLARLRLPFRVGICR